MNKNSSPLPYDLPKVIFNILLLGILIIASFNIIKPFIFGATWALMVVIATWPLMLYLQSVLWKKRYLATIVMVIVISLIFIIPLVLAINRVFDNSDLFIYWVKNFSSAELPQFTWLAKIPFVGSELYTFWNNLIHGNNTEVIIRQIQPYIGNFISLLLDNISNLGYLIFHCFLMIVFSAFFYQKGEILTREVSSLAHRLARKRGKYAITLAAQAIRAVALGIVLTALVQAFIACIGLYAVSMPYYMLLTIILFACCVAQIGPLFVIIPSAIWMYLNDHFIFCIILLVMGAVLSTLDNVIRPILIRKGMDLPLSLILIGVIGGLLAFGMIGLFIGPVVLAVSYSLLKAWVRDDIEFSGSHSSLDVTDTSK